ncbi:MAG: DnaJ domain-containing protein [bacterium]|nr:DnaJ domain-containing protein [bacterium]
MNDDPKHGIDYLIDYYALLGIEQSADGEAIKQAHRKLQMQYHPDRYEGLAKEFRAQAAEKSRIVEDGYKILSDPEKRATYDAQLNSWNGPVSTSGFPIVDLARPHFSPLDLLAGDANEKGPDLFHQMANQLSGYDPNTFALVEKMYLDSENPSAELSAAYKEQLAKKDLHLILQEQHAWETAGFHNRPIEDATSTTYAEGVERKLEVASEEIRVDVSRTMLLVTCGEIKLLGAAGEEITKALATDTSAALEEYQKMASERFQIAAEKIRAIAKERSAIAERKLLSIKIEYRPPQEAFFSKIIVCVGIREKHVWFSFFLEGTTVAEDATVDRNALETLFDEKVAEQWIKEGRNIIFFELQEGLDLREQLTWVVTQHFEKLPDNPK